MDFKAPDDWAAMVDDDAPRNPAWLSRYELHRAGCAPWRCAAAGV